MSWDARWTELAGLAATWTKDRSRGVGAVIVDSRNVLVSIGWNGFPRGLNDECYPERHERPAKYLWTEHAERNAIYNAAANGVPLLGCKLYATLFPCADCARGIIQSGIACVVTHRPDMSDEVWRDSFTASWHMLAESGTDIQWLAHDA